ncbi:Uncharacterised protein [Mycobacterium tuberculosis]|nr:Uncharacterised protein [Mycobacterium tuberculosis]CFE44395.1 Uncharacterised protein [Mycobacterium tuberculosis]CNL45604.1 Uncharacterised protein [Mycobacterium tuberculosis]CNL89607.1 Uncharacterised protein [Mycobacterium tuberculosis]CNM34697.1 Uncharacterised protein [Mycobacterium tuberculosis]
MADADHDAVRQLAAQQLVERKLQPGVQRRGTFVEEDRLGFGEQDASKGNTLLLTGGEHLGPVAFLVQPVTQWGQRHLGQRVPQGGVGDGGRRVGVAHHVTQRPQRHIRQLRQEHRLVLAARPVQGPRCVGPQFRQTAQQRGLAGPRTPGDHQRASAVQPHIERVDQPIAGRRTHLDVVELDGLVVARSGQDRGQGAAFLVGVDQPMQSDDCCAEGRKRVVVVAEERQRVVNVAEGSRRLPDIAEVDLPGE